jgi:hypothetical protein
MRDSRSNWHTDSVDFQDFCYLSIILVNKLIINFVMHDIYVFFLEDDAVNDIYLFGLNW